MGAALWGISLRTAEHALLSVFDVLGHVAGAATGYLGGTSTGSPATSTGDLKTEPHTAVRHQSFKLLLPMTSVRVRSSVAVRHVHAKRSGRSSEAPASP
jgi:hypothetical protein